MDPDEYFDLIQGSAVDACHFKSLVLQNPVFKTNIRHIHISDLWLRQVYQRRNINVVWVESGKIEADGLTKPLPKAKFQHFVKQLGWRTSGIG